MSRPDLAPLSITMVVAVPIDLLREAHRLMRAHGWHLATTDEEQEDIDARRYTDVVDAVAAILRRARA